MSYTERVMARNFARAGYGNRDIAVLLAITREEVEGFFDCDTIELIEKETDEMEDLWESLMLSL